MKHYTKSIPSPVGKLVLVANDDYLVGLLWKSDKPTDFGFFNLETAPHHPILKRTEQQLEEYFAGKRKTFDVPFLATKGTPFQKKVWKALSDIPYGQKRSYADIARAIRSPKACRAVGAANGRNPISIIVPCHRVIGANGTLTGFGGGLENKAYLLSLEETRSVCSGMV